MCKVEVLLYIEIKRRNNDERLTLCLFDRRERREGVKWKCAEWWGQESWDSWREWVKFIMKKFVDVGLKLKNVSSSFSLIFFPHWRDLQTKDSLSFFLSKQSDELSQLILTNFILTAYEKNERWAQKWWDDEE